MAGLFRCESCIKDFSVTMCVEECLLSQRILDVNILELTISRR